MYNCHVATKFRFAKNLSSPLEQDLAPDLVVGDDSAKAIMALNSRRHLASSIKLSPSSSPASNVLQMGSIGGALSEPVCVLSFMSDTTMWTNWISFLECS
jgi:hypothetical protein